MPWYPNLTGQVAPQVDDAIRRLYAHVYEIRGERANAPTTSLNVSALQVGGATPLNVTGLIGTLAQPQLARAPLYAALPNAGNVISQDGALIFFSGALYRYDASAQVWTAV